MTPNTVNIGPVALDERIDPSDPDVIGNLAGPNGAMYDTHKIIQANQDAYTRLGPILALQPDHVRSREELLDLEEIAEVTGVPIEGASVRGSGSTPRVVIYITRSEGGRSSKGMIPYEELPKSKALYEEHMDREREVATTAKARGGSESSFGEDPRVAVLQQELEKLRVEREQERAETQALVAALQERKDPAEAGEVPEDEQDNSVDGASADALTDEQVDALSGSDLDEAVKAAGIDASTGGSLQDGGLNAEEKREALKKAQS